MRRTMLRLLSTLRPGQAERDLAREIDAHLQLLEDEYRQAGMSEGAARAAARRAFGGVEQVKERQRDARMVRWLAGWPMDLRLAGRMLVKFPGLTIVGGLAMAFAICVGVVIVSVVSLFTNPTLPIPDAARLVEIRSIDVAANVQERRVLADVLEWQRSVRSLTDIGAWRDASRNLIVVPGDVRPVTVAEMSASGFRVAHARPLLGRTLDAADEGPAAPAVAVIGYDVWRRRFDSHPGVVGRTVQIGHEHVTVVGVMRPGFEFPVAHDVWLPLKTATLDQTPRSGSPLSVFARLAPGISLQAAQAELTTIGRRTAAQSPDTHRHLEPRVRPYAKMFVPDDPADVAILYAIYGFFAILLVLICGNVGLLLFARAASRQSDLVVRTALGASRGRIVAQLFAEALVLAGVAAVVGLTAADLVLRNWGMPFLEANLGRLPFWFDLRLSGRAIAVAIALTVAGAAVAGIMPALKLTRDMARQLRQSTAGSGGLQFGGVWTVVIVAQVAATVIFPALVYWEQSQVRRVEQFEFGFANERYLAVQIERDAPDDEASADAGATASSDARLATTLDELRRRLVMQPGIAGVTFTERVPSTGHPQKVVEIGGMAPGAPGHIATVAVVDASFFDVLAAPILSGRGFSAAEAASGAPVALVDQGFIEQILQGRNAIGERVRFRFPGPASRPWTPGDPNAARQGDWYEVVGVVPNLGVGAPTRAGRAAGLYLAATPERFDQVHMVVHVAGGDPMTLAPQVRDVAAAVDPTLRLADVTRVTDANSDILWILGLWVRVTVVLSAVALLLSLAGIYAVLSFTVARRTREIGVRVALGASRLRVVTAIFRRPLVQLALGIAVGTTALVLGATLIRYTEFPGSDTRLTFMDVGLILGYGIAMLAVCLLGCVTPTRRALTVAPTVALRSE